jgi:hypothetical protein
MLGIEPAPGKKPGSWRSLRVRVRREGLTVRARRGYVAAPLPREAKTDQKKDQNARRLAPEVEALVDNAKELDGISLRAMPYVLEPRDKGEARVLVAAELDLGSLAEQAAGKALQLDLTTAVTLRDTGKTLYSYARIDGKSVDPKGGWRSVAREFELPPGVAQARVVVREQTSGAIGAVTTRFEVPASTGLRVSTPVVTDRVSKPENPGVSPRAVFTAHRRFALGGEVYLEFEVFGARPEPSGEARVSADLEVRAPDGTVVRRAPATRIVADNQKRLVRLVGFGVLAEGDYVLLLNVRDEVAGTSVACREDFKISSVAVRLGASDGFAAGASSDDLSGLLDRAGAFVESLSDSFRNIVAEEVYEQWMPATQISDVARRTLRSDLVFVPLPGEIPWTMFRDVYEVNGRKLRDRQARLERLFLHPAADAMVKADAILRESARYNLGSFQRTVNTPTVALLFLLPRNQPRFQFQRKNKRFIDGVEAEELEYIETARPTLVRDVGGGDVPTRGQVWIDPTRGSVLRIETDYDLQAGRALTVRANQRAHVETSFRRDAALNTHVPVEMKELYVWPNGNSEDRLEGTARYSNFRRFSVDTDESATDARATPSEPKPPEP